MKIILSIQPVHYPLTGIGRYSYELASRLPDFDEIESLHYFGLRRFAPSLPSLEQSNRPNSRSYRLRRALRDRRWVVSLYQHLLPLAQRWALRGYQEALYHGPNFILPPSASLSVATFHDLSPFTWSHCHPPERVRFMRRGIERSLKRADALITVSEFVRHEVADYFSWPIEKIHTVHNGLSDAFFPRDPVVLQPELARLGLSPGGYCLFVGTIEPRKNIDTLLKAYRQLPPSVRQRWPLVLTGYPGWQSDQIHALIQQAEREGWARYFGYTSEADLPLLYSGARLFAFPSLYEGFGLPVLEAMGSGVPVVCSDRASLPEVADDAALMGEALDVDALREHLQRGLEDDTWRSGAIVRGLQVSRRFSWHRCAAETVGVYRKVLSGPRR